MEKTVCQIQSKDGKPIAGNSAPTGFVSKTEPPRSEDPTLAKFLSKPSWGEPFAAPSAGNDVEFFVTGDAYFLDVAKAIGGAKASILIAGWQINADVEMGDGKTLFEHLRRAVERGVNVYVMPWMAPPPLCFATGVLQSVLALCQLNAGLKERRAWVLPAIGQSDIAGALGMLGFSHHQKTVVIDGKTGYLGGIDLAYGRRDDGRFDLGAQWRKGNEFYSPCIPMIETLSAQDKANYVPLMELLAACSDTWLNNTGAWWFSPAESPLMTVPRDKLSQAARAYEEVAWRVQHWWKADSWLSAPLRRVKAPIRGAIDRVVDGALGTAEQQVRWLAKGTWDYLGQATREALLKEGAEIAAAVTWCIDWLRGGHLDELPPNVYHVTGQLMQGLSLAFATTVAQQAMRRKAPYSRWVEKRKVMPYGGKLHDTAKQPRMPWHDVQMRVKGPAVHDLTLNFVRRWDAVVVSHEGALKDVSEKGYALANKVFGALQMPEALINSKQPLGLPKLSKALLLDCPPATARKHTVQVLRSASLRQCDLEDAATPEGAQPRKNTATLRDTPTRHDASSQKKRPPQNNCLQAMLNAILGAQHFLYIEGQFFQSAFGKQEAAEELSGPMGVMCSPWRAHNAERYLTALNLKRGMSPAEMIRKLDLAKLRRVVADMGGDDLFWTDLRVILSNLAQVETSKLMGKAQEHIANPLSNALGARIRRAILDGLPFHVYMVLPVHPEGPLNNIAIASQIHLTMQSLVFGSHSLVNTIRRAILEKGKRDAAPRMSDEERHALYRRIDAMAPPDLVKAVPDAWNQYLTLLNLRNWTTLNGQPVTEQIYVHSKLLIADDRLAILGSANINDRSLLGNRDSELAMMIHDGEGIKVLLDGKRQFSVSKSVHNLRTRLWRKLFGLAGNCDAPATELAALVTQPASSATWTALQKRAATNGSSYKQAFPHVPYSVPDLKEQDVASSIWPTWDNAARKQSARMPFQEPFWRSLGPSDKPCSWEAKTNPKSSIPANVLGFICALPIRWTTGENNESGLNLTLLAKNDGPLLDTTSGVALAAVGGIQEPRA
ncbi:phospholipase [Cupriavidus sp. KB_39]|uniref:phospholipase D-like domain-containing protein n=1 Tax=Cupriavidus sp. KB_39 TaxID=3233036 RepID=UPI003F923A63